MMRQSKEEMERVGMLALLPGIEYAVTFFERAVGELRAELNTIYSRIRGNGNMQPAEPAFGTAPLKEEGKLYIDPDSQRREKKPKRKYKTKPQPEKIDGWYTRTGLQKLWGLERSAIFRRAKELKIRTRKVQGASGTPAFLFDPEQSERAAGKTPQVKMSQIKIPQRKKP